MKNMTRMMAAVLLLAMALTLCACQTAQPTNPVTTTQAPAPTTTVPATTEATDPEETIPEGYADYKVTVLNADGTPAVGQMVIICDEASCSFPTETDENGVAVIRREEKEGWKTKVDGVEMEYVYFEAGSKEVTITLP